MVRCIRIFFIPIVRQSLSSSGTQQVLIEAVMSNFNHENDFPSVSPSNTIPSILIYYDFEASDCKDGLSSPKPKSCITNDRHRSSLTETNKKVASHHISTLAQYRHHHQH